ncbi:MAG TPA: type II toxin-antitoxin system VapC family toxin [Caulobacteraceae bacterium]|nr:type II toxin-antitoxin system VapC family toxin [Caulobacteraceae bacterium]
MTSYFDASVLVSMFVRDEHTDRVHRWIATLSDRPLVSNWAVTEFTSALGLRRRIDVLSRDEREQIELALDGWLYSADRIEVAAADLTFARFLMRSEATPLKAPDALHLAIAMRWGARLATTDRQLGRAAEEVGVQVEDL